jgi:hypothetical protein
MSLSNRVKNLKGKSPDKLVKSIIAVMKDMHWSWEQMAETPISSFFVIHNELSQIAKQQQAESKKGRKR